MKKLFLSLLVAGCLGSLLLGGYNGSATTFLNDPLATNMWALENSKYPKMDTGIERAWQITKGSEEVIVAVIDRGVDITHEDLQGQLWKNKAEIPNDHIDNDGNGYVDDFDGWDFWNNDATIEERDIRDNPGSHGTRVAGVIAAAENGLGTVGVAPKVKIMPLVSGGNSYEQIQYAIDNGADIVNMSYSEGLRETVLEVMKNAPNVLFVTSAGNDNVNIDINLQYPASYSLPNLISVAAIEEEGTLTYYTNYGVNSVSIAAPGRYLTTTGGNSYGSANGTSFAAPYVAAVGALVKSANPNFTGSQLKTRLENSGTEIASMIGKTKTGKIINAGKAVNPIIGTIMDVFPDANLAKEIAIILKKNVNETISFEEAESIKMISMPFATQTVRNIQGLEYLTQLQILSIYGDSSTKGVPFPIDVSHLLHLHTLNLNNYGIESIELSTNKELKSLTIYDGKLKTINLENNPKLERVIFQRNQLTKLSLPTQTELEYLDVRYNHLSSIFLENSKKLTTLFAAVNALTYPLVLDKNILLETLDISNNSLDRIYLNKNTALKLQYLKLDGNPWSQIYVRNADTNSYITSLPNLSSKFVGVNF